MKIGIIGDHHYASGIAKHLESIGASVQIYSSREGHKKAVRVQKRFMNTNDADAKQRFQDLFRVVFEQDPEKEISQQLDGEGRAIFEKLTEFELDYLKSRFEGFEDFDLIISLPVFAKSGTSGLACVGESQVDSIIYLAQDSVVQSDIIDKILSNNENFEIAIVGDALNKSSLKKIEKWLIEAKGSRRVFGITSTTEPFISYSFDELNHFEKTRITNFEQRLKSWQALEDYEKVKIPKPAEPVPCWVFFAGHELSVISKLSDQDRLYITCEMSPHKRIMSGRGEQNSKYPLKTVAVDQLIVAKGFIPDTLIYQGLREPIRVQESLGDNQFEAGFFEFNEEQSLEQIIQALEKYLDFYFIKSES